MKRSDGEKKEMMLKALKPKEYITVGGDFLIYGESCNTVLVITVYWGKVREPQCTSGYVNSCQEC